MKFKNPTPHPLSAGFSSLIVVLFAVTLLTAMMLAIYSMTLILTRQSTRFTTGQKAYFLAEGTMLETTQRIQNYLDNWDPWPAMTPSDPPLVETYDFHGATIDRTLNCYDSTISGVFQYEIEVTAAYLGSTRKIFATFLPTTPTTQGGLSYEEVEP